MKKLFALVATALTVVALAAPALAAAPVKHATVQDMNFRFSPGRLTIKKGTKVVWTWEGSGVGHNVTVLRGPSKFHSRTKATGTFTHVFRKKGTWVLYCTIHTWMKETVVVKG